MNKQALAARTVKKPPSEEAHKILLCVFIDTYVYYTNYY